MELDAAIGSAYRFFAYSPSHISMLALFIALIASLYLSRNWLRQGQRSRYGRFVLAAILILSELTLNLWYINQSIYNVSDTLPLELCSISLYLCIFMLLFNSRFIFQIAYFIGIGGAIQALLTPVLYYGYPHFRFFQFFIAHIAIILAVLYMAWVECLRPTLKSVGLTMGFLNVLLVIVLPINWLTGGNYMFLARKPDTASLLDYLGPYPWYLLSMEAFALCFFLLLYLPFAKGSKRSAQLAREVKHDSD
ncbi:TIGR02206 family membrane protein [Paenibacillus sp. GCM10027626]|uniref:YwaF family protein n=1 Tax=Paenibacillus sp. GCM10027626 TaxID=3273411 RepID=UPI003634DAE3